MGHILEVSAVCFVYQNTMLCLHHQITIRSHSAYMELSFLKHVAHKLHAACHFMLCNPVTDFIRIVESGSLGCQGLFKCKQLKMFFLMASAGLKRVATHG
jgi:hypothetical protein